MAGNEDRKAALIAELARARAEIGRKADAVGARLDVGARVQRAVSRHRWWWLGGAVVVGVLLAKLPARTKKIYVDEKGRNVRRSNAVTAGLLLGAVKVAFDLARPTLFKMAARRAENFVRERWATRD